MKRYLRHLEYGMRHECSPFTLLAATAFGLAVNGLGALDTAAPLSHTDHGPRIEHAVEYAPRVAVVLSGGSAFGMAHIGVLEEIERAGIPIDCIAGTSMGAIVGGLYAAGYAPAELERIVTTMDWSAVLVDRKASVSDRFERTIRERHALKIDLASNGVSIGAGLFDGQNILSYFTALSLHALVIRDFDALPIPYRAVAADIMTGEKIVFKGGSLAEAMRSSMSIPAVFRPYEREGRRLIDGGVVDNLPTAIAKELGADIIIAVESRGPGPKSPDSLKTPVDIAGQTFNLFILQNMRPSRKEADLLISSDLSGFTTTSYAEGEAIIARGRAAGRAAAPALAALADRIAASRPLLAPEEQPNRQALREPPLILALRIEGGGPADEALARSTFAPLIGRRYSREELRTAIDSTYVSGRYDFVKFDIEPHDEGNIGVITLIPARQADNSAYIGLDFQGAISSAFTSDFALASGLLIQNLTGPHSALFVSTALFNRLDGMIEYFQPFGPFFAKPWFRYTLEYDSYSAGGFTVGTKFRSYGGGAWLGLALGRNADFMLGYSLENMLSVGQFDILPLDISGFRGALRLDTRDSAIFASRGLALLAYGRLFATNLGGESSFATSEALLDLAIPLGKLQSLGIAAYASTDWSGLVPGATTALYSYFSTLRQPGMFYGMSPHALSAIGNHVLGMGLEYRRRLAPLHPLLGGDLYLVGNASAGSVILGEDCSPEAWALLRWSASLGLGARFTRYFGALATFSLVGYADVEQPFGLALSLDIGSFAGRLEDRR